MLNSNQRLLIRRLLYFPIDFINRLSGKKDKLTPDKGLIFTGNGEFRTQGEHFIRLFAGSGMLKPEHRVLDVGCGIGRIAIPLLNYLNEKGSYEGFDIVNRGIDWCVKNINSQNPSFRFLHSDIYNDLYNSGGKMNASEFIFPYSKHEFDSVFIISVFTHMLKNEVFHYLDEISRVSKKSGRLFITWFLINDESESLMKSGRSKFTFQYQFDNYRTLSLKAKSGNVAYDEEYILKELQLRNFKIIKIIPGYWCGRDKNIFSEFQDTMIVEKY